MKYIYRIMLILLLPLAACEKMIQVDEPYDQPTTSSLFETEATASSTVTGLYSHMMRSNSFLPYYMSLFTGFYGDELDYYGNAPMLRDLYKNNLNAQTAYSNEIWTNSYNFIYQANSIIGGLNKSKSVGEAVKKQLTGEALFIRAFYLFYLTNFYGEIPVPTTTDYVSNAIASNIAVPQVYEQIVADLVAARDLLNEKYVSANSITETTERIRPNKFTASALLARVYLFQKNYSLAELEASKVISHSFYSIESIDDVFKRTSKEAIWQLQMPSGAGTGNTYEGSYFRLTGAPNANSQFLCAAISPLLYNQFLPTDLRRSKWISSVTAASVTYRFPWKYKTISTTTIDEYTNVFRLAEVYLTSAEAKANLGKIDEAVLDVNRTRTRAGLPLLGSIFPAITPAQLLNEIALERRRELFCEWGMRWMDIRRSNDLNNITSVTATHKGITWLPYMLNWPIPENDIINNPKLKQNAGY